MTAPLTGLASGTNVRDVLSSLSALQVLSMVMFDASGEEEILDLAVSAIPSLARDCHAEGVWLDGQWRAVTSPRGQIGCPAGLEDQVALLGGVGGLLSSPGRGWLCALPITSLGAASGCLVVSSPEAPPEHEQALLKTLAQQTGVTVSRTRLLQQERGMHERIADEQATLRRVAGLISGGAPPEKVFAAVAAEAGRLLGADFAVMSRYGPDGAATVVGEWAKGDGEQPLPPGTFLEQGGMNVHTLEGPTGGASRGDDYGDNQSPGATIARQWGVRSVVGVPIYIGGHLWGQIGVASGRPARLPADTEGRLTGFSELVATAIASAQAHAELTASRARIVAAADVTRRRIERDLHDGAQQRLVSLALQLRAVQAAAPAEIPELVEQLDGVVNGLAGVMEDLLEIARGIHPAILANGGLRPALKTLARRSALPVALEVSVDGRLAEQVELAAYYAVAEALTNAAKHAHATVVDVRVMANADRVDVWIRDDGLGGADIGRGSGLEGLLDRVRTLGGDMALQSPSGRGTTLEISLPLNRPV